MADGSTRRLHARLRACTQDENASITRYSSPPAVPKLLNCLASAVAWCKQGRLCGPFRALQLYWGSRHSAPASLRRSSSALLSGVTRSRQAHVLNVFGRFQRQIVSLSRTSRSLTPRTSTRSSRGASARLCQPPPLLVVLHVLSIRERSDRTVLQLPCAKLLLVLGPRSGAEVRRQVLIRPNWIEVARSEGQGVRQNNARPVWSLLSRGPQVATGGADVFCVNGWKMHPVMSVQFHNYHCERCCVGRSQIARKLASGRAGESLQLNEEEPWGCTAPQVSPRQCLCCREMRAAFPTSAGFCPAKKSAPSNLAASTG